MFQKVLYYSGFIFSCYAFVFILWQNQAYKFQRFKFHAFFMSVFNLSTVLKNDYDMNTVYNVNLVQIRCLTGINYCIEAIVKKNSVNISK